MWFENVGAFIDYGFQHIVPEGPDHVLFVIALYLNARSWGSLLMQVTAFTLAHTLTLALAATSVISVAPEIVEPLIAVSIVVLAIEAIAFPDAHRLWRIPVVAAFGLLHGLGFGTVMSPAVLSADTSAALVGITIGVELGHLTVLVATGIVAFMVLIALRSLKRPGLYRLAFVIPVAAIIALVGAFWTLQRTGVITV
jgi:hydrogenase/urease accessory protein HupE